MKRVLLLSLLVLSFMTSVVSAQTKKVLLEEFTGSWCGWCPRGIWAIEQLKEKHPGKFIVASFHNGDPMVTPGGDSIQNGDLLQKISGWPNGWLQRRTYGQTLSIDANSWDTATTRLLTETPTAEVSLTNVLFDAATRTVTVTIDAKFTADVTADLRFNVYVVEDNVSGPAGTTWDQHNYLTSRQGYEDNPFYNEPDVIPGFMHMNVVRMLPAGITGIKGTLPATATTGSTYSQTFTFKLPQNIKADDARVIGFVAKYKKGTSVSVLKQNEILNADEVKVTNLPALSGIVTSSSKSYIMATRNAETVRELTITSTNSTPTSVALSLDESTVLPAGWLVTYDPTAVAVPANGTAKVNMKIVAPTQSNYVSIITSAMPIAEGFTGRQAPVTVNALTSGTKYLSFGSDGYIPYRMDDIYTQDFAAVPFTEEVMDAYPPKDFDVAIFSNINFFDYEGLNGAPPAIVPALNEMLDAGKKALITSTFGLYYAFDEGAQYFGVTHTDAVDNFFTNRLGINYEALEPRSSSGTPSTVAVNGIDGDVIGDGISYNSYYYQSDVFTITKAETTKPILYLDDDQTAYGGFRYDNGSGQRLVYLNINLGLTQVSGDAQAKLLIKKSIDFLLNGTSSVKTSNEAQHFSVSNFPNPASASTKFTYSITDRAPVSLVVRDIMGREVSSLVSNEMQDNGTYEAVLNLSDLSNGTYFYTLTAGNETVTKVLNVVK